MSVVDDHPLRPTDPTPTFYTFAACAEENAGYRTTDEHFGITGAELARARYRCIFVCAVRSNCLEHALEHEHGFEGIWGGLDIDERSREKRSRRRRGSLPVDDLNVIYSHGLRRALSTRQTRIAYRNIRGEVASTWTIAVEIRRSGTVRSGDVIGELSDRTGKSRHTVRSSLQNLEKREAIVVRRRGRTVLEVALTSSTVIDDDLGGIDS